MWLAAVYYALIYLAVGIIIIAVGESRTEQDDRLSDVQILIGVAGWPLWLVLVTIVTIVRWASVTRIGR